MIVAAARDDPRVRELLGALADAYVQTYGAHDLDDDDPADHAAPTGGCLLVVDDTGVPVAAGCWRYHDTTTCELRRFYVDPAARGRAHAAALCDALLASAHRAGYTRAVCATTAGDIVQALGGRPTAP